MVMSRDEALRRLDYATRRIETVGWAQGASRATAGPDGDYITAPGCLMGSLTTDGEYYVFKALAQASAQLGTVYIPTLDNARSALSSAWPVFSRRFYKTLKMSPVSWNDRPERKQEEVVAFLKSQHAEIYALTSEQWIAEQTAEQQKTLDNAPQI